MKYGLILLIALAIIGTAFYVLYAMYKRDEEEFLPSNVKDLEYDKETEIMSFKGGRTENPYAVRGSSTVWRTMGGKRLDTLMESKLSDIYDYWRYNYDDEKKR